MVLRELRLKRLDLLKKMAPELRSEEGKEGKREGRAFQEEEMAHVQPSGWRQCDKSEGHEGEYSGRRSESKVSRARHLA